MQLLLDQITNNTTLFNVVAQAPDAEELNSVHAATASAALKTLLEAATANAYAVEAPEGEEPPDAVYHLTSAQSLSLVGAKIATDVTFVVTLRETDYPKLMTLLAAVEAQILASADSISITDAAADYAAAQNYFLVALELSYVVPAVSGSPDYPAVLVSFDSTQADESNYDNLVNQRVIRNYSMTIISDTDNVEALRADLQGALLGWQETAAHFEMEYRAGSDLDMPGGLYAWREQYSDGHYIQQS